MIYNAAMERKTTCIRGKEIRPLNLYYRQFASQKHDDKINSKLANLCLTFK